MLILRFNVPTPSLETYLKKCFLLFFNFCVPKTSENLCCPFVFVMNWVLTPYKSHAKLIFCGSGTRLGFPMFFVLECTLGGDFKCFKSAPFCYFSSWVFEPLVIDFAELGLKGSKGHVFFWFLKVFVVKTSETFVFFKF